jgi:folate-dependent phosphoribosylglycinamide formyltransferase PurN
MQNVNCTALRLNANGIATASRAENTASRGHRAANERRKRNNMQLIYYPAKSGKKMNIVCFISSSGTNYREIVSRDPNHHYLVYTNRPGCGGIAIAKANGHEVIELSHVPYLKDVRQKYGAGKVPRNCDERVAFEREVSRLIEAKLGKRPDLICLAGYDQWTTDWLVDRYYPKMLNVHPGDTTKGYEGLHWTPSAKAILAGDEAIRSTLFIVDKGEDTGPVLVQSAPLNIARTLSTAGLSGDFEKIAGFAKTNAIKTHEHFTAKADKEMQETMAKICGVLQENLKVSGDWQIFPFAVHDLIAKGRAAIDDRTVYVDGKAMPVYGFRLR